MSLFNIKSAQSAAIVKAPRVAKAPERIFPKYVAETLRKIQRSIEDAQGRYEQGFAHKNPTPSLLWKVVKAAPEGADLLEERVSFKFTIGIRKQELNADGEKELILPASALIPALEELREMVKAIEASPESAEAKAFHEEAKLSGKPTRKPEDSGFARWVYDSETDSYVGEGEAVAS